MNNLWATILYWYIFILKVHYYISNILTIFLEHFFFVLAWKNNNNVLRYFFSNRITHIHTIVNDRWRMKAPGLYCPEVFLSVLNRKNKIKKLTWVLFVCFIVMSKHINVLKTKENWCGRTDKPFAAHWQLCRFKSSKSQILKLHSSVIICKSMITL